MNRNQMEKTFGGPVVFGRARNSSRLAWFWRSGEKHLWCAACARSFPNGVHRCVEGTKTCPYADCDGDLASGARDWSSVRQRHPNYPTVPWMSVRYPDGAPVLAPATGN